MSITYIFFFRACRAQGLDRNTLPYKGWFQPYSAYFGLFFTSIIVVIQGYTVFLPGKFTVPTFLTYYTMIFVCILLYSGWKLLHKTKVVKAAEADLVWDKPVIDRYEEMTTPPLGIWEDLAATLKKPFVRR